MNWMKKILENEFAYTETISLTNNPWKIKKSFLSFQIANVQKM